MAKEFINPKKLFAPPGFTQVVTAQGGKMIYISGQVAFNDKAELIGKGSLADQTTQTFENLRAALKAAGADFKDVVKLNYYVAGLKPEDISVIREIRNKYLPAENPPASTLVGVLALFRPDVLIEIEAVAVTN
jgi:enamine deaminase RidA (YjgF/YER057c/UK114 family)